MAETWYCNQLSDPWIYRLSGSFTSTIKQTVDMFAADGIEQIQGISYNQSHDCQLAIYSPTFGYWHMTGFSSTVTASQGTNVFTLYPWDVSGHTTVTGDFPVAFCDEWSGGKLKLYADDTNLSALTDELDVNGLTSSPEGICLTEEDTFWSTLGPLHKLYHTQGQFTTTILDSLSIAEEFGWVNATGISFNGSEIIFLSYVFQRIAKIPFPFSTTLIQDEATITGFPTGLEHYPYAERVAALGGVQYDKVLTDNLILFENLSPIFGFASDTIDFGETIDEGNVINRTISEDLGFIHTVHNTIVYKTIAETITFSEDVSFGERTSDGLTFSELVETSLSTTTEDPDALVFTEDIDIAGEWNRTLTDALNFTEDVGQYTEDVSVCELDTEQVTLPQDPGSRGSVILTSPGGSTTIVLRNPVFGNIEVVELARTYNFSRNGKRHSYRQGFWPKSRVLKFSSVRNTEAVANAYRDFIFDYAGRNIMLTDHENRKWTGIIINVDGPVIQETVTCGYTIDIEFAGELINLNQHIGDTFPSILDFTEVLAVEHVPGDPDDDIVVLIDTQVPDFGGKWPGDWLGETAP
jgi:hypothetical protein